MSNNNGNSGSANLWWAYDTDNGTFAALPAGPMLLPAIGIFAFVSIVKALKSRNRSPESMIGSPMYNSSLYQKDKARFYYLVKKKIAAARDDTEGLSLAEMEELRRLKYPTWNKGRPWHNW